MNKFITSTPENNKEEQFNKKQDYFHKNKSLQDAFDVPSFYQNKSTYNNHHKHNTQHTQSQHIQNQINHPYYNHSSQNLQSASKYKPDFIPQHRKQFKSESDFSKVINNLQQTHNNNHANYNNIHQTPHIIEPQHLNAIDNINTNQENKLSQIKITNQKKSKYDIFEDFDEDLLQKPKNLKNKQISKLQQEQLQQIDGFQQGVSAYSNITGFTNDSKERIRSVKFIKRLTDTLVKQAQRKMNTSNTSKKDVKLYDNVKHNNQSNSYNQSKENSRLLNTSIEQNTKHFDEKSISSATKSSMEKSQENKDKVNSLSGTNKFISLDSEKLLVKPEASLYQARQSFIQLKNILSTPLLINHDKQKEQTILEKQQYQHNNYMRLEKMISLKEIITDMQYIYDKYIVVCTENGTMYIYKIIKLKQNNQNFQKKRNSEDFSSPSYTQTAMNSEMNSPQNYKKGLELQLITQFRAHYSMGKFTFCYTYGLFFTIGQTQKNRNEVKFWVFDDKQATQLITLDQIHKKKMIHLQILEEFVEGNQTEIIYLTGGNEPNLKIWKMKFQEFSFKDNNSKIELLFTIDTKSQIVLQLKSDFYKKNYIYGCTSSSILEIQFLENYSDLYQINMEEQQIDHLGKPDSLQKIEILQDKILSISAEGYFYIMKNSI